MVKLEFLASLHLTIQGYFVLEYFNVCVNFNTIKAGKDRGVWFGGAEVWLQHISLSIFTHVHTVQYTLATSAGLSYFFKINYGLLSP